MDGLLVTSAASLLLLSSLVFKYHSISTYSYIFTEYLPHDAIPQIEVRLKEGRA